MSELSSLSITPIARRTARIGLDHNDIEFLQAFRATLEPELDGIVEEVTNVIHSSPDVAHFFQDHQARIRLKALWRNYTNAMFGGVYDGEYQVAREKVGDIHAKIGVSPELYLWAFHQIFVRVCEFALRSSVNLNPGTFGILQAFYKIAFLDVGITMDTYIRGMEQRRRCEQARFIDTVTLGADQVNKGVADIAETAAEHAQAAQTQAGSVAKVNATLQGVRQLSHSTLESAYKLLDVSERTEEASSRSEGVVQLTLEGMAAVEAQVGTIHQKVLALSDHSDNIGEVILTVNEIAEQSKLLSLNASIEAARAGTLGLAFGVVATEMRELAEQSKQATWQVRQLLNDIRVATGDATSAVAAAMEKVEESRKLAHQTGIHTRDLKEAIRESVNSSRAIVAASKEQGRAVNQAVEAMGTIERMSIATAAGMMRIKGTIKDLNEIATMFSAYVHGGKAGQDSPVFSPK